jgi:uncharacterized membrane protein
MVFTTFIYPIKRQVYYVLCLFVSELNIFCMHSLIIFIAQLLSIDMQEKKSELEKEFELERLILFSDAVFAIAITLLIIEIKFPEVDKNATPLEILKAFKPTIIQFIAFCLSFVFIGVAWARHLQLCRFLKKYNNGLIRRNLALLFFIICFPFSASGITEHIRPGFLLPIFIYMGNIAGVITSQFTLTNYIFYKKPHLSVPGLDAEKHYLFLKSKWSAYIFIVVFLLYTILSLLFIQASYMPVLAFYSLPILLLIMRKRIRKYKPVEAEE